MVWVNYKSVWTYEKRTMSIWSGTFLTQLYFSKFYYISLKISLKIRLNDGRRSHNDVMIHDLIHESSELAG